MYVLEDVIDVSLFYIKDPHMSVAEAAIHCYRLLWTPGHLSGLAMLALFVNFRTPFTTFFFFWVCKWVVKRLEDL